MRLHNLHPPCSALLLPAAITSSQATRASLILLLPRHSSAGDHWCSPKECHRAPAPCWHSGLRCDTKPAQGTSVSPHNPPSPALGSVCSLSTDSVPCSFYTSPTSTQRGHSGEQFHEYQAGAGSRHSVWRCREPPQTQQSCQRGREDRAVTQCLQQAPTPASGAQQVKELRSEALPCGDPPALSRAWTLRNYVPTHTPWVWLSWSSSAPQQPSECRASIVAGRALITPCALAGAEQRSQHQSCPQHSPLTRSWGWAGR